MKKTNIIFFFTQLCSPRTAFASNLGLSTVPAVDLPLPLQHLYIKVFQNLGKWPPGHTCKRSHRANGAWCLRIPCTFNKPRCGVIFCHDHVMIVRRIFNVACCNAASATTSIAPKSASLHAWRRTRFIDLMCAARPICPDKCGARILCFFFQLAALLCLPKVTVNWNFSNSCLLRAISICSIGLAETVLVLVFTKVL